MKFELTARDRDILGRISRGFGYASPRRPASVAEWAGTVVGNRKIGMPTIKKFIRLGLLEEYVYGGRPRRSEPLLLTTYKGLCNAGLRVVHIGHGSRRHDLREMGHPVSTWDEVLTAIKEHNRYHRTPKIKADISMPLSPNARAAVRQLTGIERVPAKWYYHQLCWLASGPDPAEDFGPHVVEILRAIHKVAPGALPLRTEEFYGLS